MSGTDNTQFLFSGFTIFMSGGLFKPSDFSFAHIDFKTAV